VPPPTTEIEKRLLACHEIAWSIANSLNPTAVLSRDDLYQAAMLDLAKNAHKFDPGRGVQFNTWAYSVMRKAMQYEIRRVSWRKESKIGEQRTLTPIGDHDDQPVEDQLEEQYDLDHRLSTLTKEERFVVVATAQGYNPREIARMLGLRKEGGQAQVRQTLSQAVGVLAEAA
jgi:RNA polymerase sigma factor (sigma-70 family)